jgi:hypothetical protein
MKSNAFTSAASAFNPLNAKQHTFACIWEIAKRFLFLTTIRTFEESRIYLTIFRLTEALHNAIMHYNCVCIASTIILQVESFTTEFFPRFRPLFQENVSISIADLV